MSKDIIVTNPRLLKLLGWFENQSAVVKSFILAVVRFSVIALVVGVGLGAYLLGGPNAAAVYGTFLGVWYVSYRKMERD